MSVLFAPNAPCVCIVKTSQLKVNLSITQQTLKRTTGGGCTHVRGHDSFELAGFVHCWTVGRCTIKKGVPLHLTTIIVVCHISLLYFSHTHTSSMHFANTHTTGLDFFFFAYRSTWLASGFAESLAIQSFHSPLFYPFLSYLCFSSEEMLL